MSCKYIFTSCMNICKLLVSLLFIILSPLLYCVTGQSSCLSCHLYYTVWRDSLPAYPVTSTILCDGTVFLLILSPLLYCVTGQSSCLSCHSLLYCVTEQSSCLSCHLYYTVWRDSLPAYPVTLYYTVWRDSLPAYPVTSTILCDGTVFLLILPPLLYCVTGQSSCLSCHSLLYCVTGQSSCLSCHLYYTVWRDSLPAYPVTSTILCDGTVFLLILSPLLYCVTEQSSCLFSAFLASGILCLLTQSLSDAQSEIKHGQIAPSALLLKFNSNGIQTQS